MFYGIFSPAELFRFQERYILYYLPLYNAFCEFSHIFDKYDFETHNVDHSACKSSFILQKHSNYVALVLEV